MDETLSMEDQWLDIILGRFEKEGCVVLLCCREDETIGEHIIYQTKRGQLQHVLFKYNGLQEPSVIVTEKLVMLSPPSRALS